MDESKDIVKREIAYYMAFDPDYIKYFKESLIAGIIQLCIGVTLQHPSKERLISGFIAGLALLHIAKKTGSKEYMEEAKELLKPVENLIFKKGYEPEYRKMLTESIITGSSIINVNGVMTPITANEILNFNKITNGRLLTPADVYKREREFIEFRKNQSTPANKLQGATKPLNDYIIEHYREILPPALKEAFFNNKGKTIRLMIEVLKAKGILSVICSDEELYRALKSYFNWDIGSRVGIFQTYSYNPNNAKCKKEFQNTSIFIDTILKRLQ